MHLQKDSYVSYGSNGLCRVEGKETRRFGEKEREYYILTPCSAKGSTIFVPADNAVLVAKIKPLLTESEIRDMLRRAPEEEFAWEEDLALRKAHFLKISELGDRLEQLKLVLALGEKKKKREAEGKKLLAFEEHALEVNRNLLSEEFAHVLRLAKEEAQQRFFSPLP